MGGYIWRLWRLLGAFPYRFLLPELLFPKADVNPNILVGVMDEFSGKIHSSNTLCA
jgi:hypothetical protein